MNNIVPRQSVALAIFACCVSAYMVVRLLSGLVHAYYLGPILDEWAFVPLLARFYTGHLTLSDLWAQHNEHRPLFSRVLYLLDYVFFRGTKEFLFTMTYVFQTTHVLLLSWVLYHYADISRSARVIGVCVIVSLLFSAAQVETLHMAIGVQWSGLCMLGTATFLTIAGMAECNTQGKTVALLLILAIVLAAAATCDLASGILLWPLMLGLCLWLRLPSRYAVAIAAAGGVILFLYLKNYHSENFLHSDPLESLRSLNKVFVYAAAYLGSPVQVLGARACVVMGTLGIGIGVLTVLHVLLYREPLTNVRGALAAILCFLMGTALLTGLGRINFGLEQAAFSSRYMTITLTFWLVLFIYWLVALPRLTQEGSSTVQTVLVALSGLLVGIAVLAQEQNAKAFSMKKPELNTAGIAVILGVPDRDLLKTLYPFPEELMNLAPILREYHVSQFADQSFNVVGQTLLSKFGKRNTNTCVGSFDSLHMLQQTSGFAAVNGWGWDLEKGRGFDLVAIAADGGSILGVAYTGSPRPDVVAARGGRSLYSGWNGLTRISTGSLTAFGIDLSARTWCRLSGEKELQNSGPSPAG